MECEYGCGKEAKFQTKGGRNCCCKSPNSCDINRKKNSESLKKNYKKTGRNNKNIYHTLPEETKNNMLWSKGLTKDTNETLRVVGENLSKKYKNGILKHSWSGRSHTKETKQKISNSASASNNGYVKTKYYEVFSKYQNKLVKVQGSYELKYALVLNEQNINWIRDRKINLKYKLHDDDYIHTYYPDFYLVDLNEYIEIKGFFWRSKDGKVDDYRKMQKVLECNRDKNIVIYFGKNLEKIEI